MTNLKERVKETENNNSYFNPLTGVRAVAAFMVYIHHYNPFSKKIFGLSVYNFFSEFHIGVTIFFVLSGFLIALRYSEMHKFSLRSYMVKRFARVYPIYFLLTTLTFFSMSLQNPEFIFLASKEYYLNISFLRGFFEDFKFSGIGQGWSLTVEETFYLVAPISFALIKRNYTYLIILPYIFMSAGVLLVIVFSKLDLLGFFHSYEFMFNYTFMGRCFEFFIGISLAIIYKKNLFTPSFKFFTYTGIFGIIISCFLISLLKGDYGYGIRHPLGKFINTIILPIFGVAFLFYGLLIEKTYFSKFLGSKFMVLLGKSSYIFYLIHLGVIAAFVQRYSNNYVLVFILLNVISIILFKLIEEPLNSYLRKKLTYT